MEDDGGAASSFRQRLAEIEEDQLELQDEPLPWEMGDLDNGPGDDLDLTEVEASPVDGERKDKDAAAFLEDAIGDLRAEGRAVESGVVHPLPAIVEERVLKRKVAFQLPWERKPFAGIFGASKSESVVVDLPEVGLKDTLLAQPVQAPLQRDNVPHFVAKRIRMTAIIASEDQLRWRAMQKFRKLVLADPLCSELGKSLLDVAGRLMEDKQISQTFEDAFSGKSTATMVRRAGSLNRYSDWVIGSGYGNPLAFPEPLLYKYMVALREKQAAPTVADSFLRAVVFTYHCCGLRHLSLDSILSARVKGAAEAQFTMKRPLRQAIPLTVDMVAALEYRACESPEEYETLVAGHLCLCIYASCRFSDATRITEVDVSIYAGVCLVETQTIHHKTATNKERKTTFLPLMALGIGVTGVCWADGWVEARKFWLRNCKKGLAIPARSEVTGNLLERNLTSGEGVLYLKQFLKPTSRRKSTSRSAHTAAR